MHGGKEKTGSSEKQKEVKRHMRTRDRKFLESIVNSRPDEVS